MYMCIYWGFRVQGLGFKVWGLQGLYRELLGIVTPNNGKQMDKTMANEMGTGLIQGFIGSLSLSLSLSLSRSL